MSKIVYIEQAPSLDDYNQLRHDVGWGRYADLAALESGLCHSLYHICAKDGDITIGIGRVIGDGSITFYIQDVIVDADYQGRGIGKRIMEYIMRFIASKATPGAVVGLMAAKGKEGFYEKFGFIGRPTDQYGKGMIIMWPEN
jgi:GNAT superfamily N-acetyltransferase